MDKLGRMGCIIQAHLPTAGVANPPGIPLLQEIPRPNLKPNNIAFRITWAPPSFPLPLAHVKYSLRSGNSPILTETNSAEDFFGLYSYRYIYVYMVDTETGGKLSERSPYVWGEIQGDCNRHGE